MYTMTSQSSSQRPHSDPFPSALNSHDSNTSSSSSSSSFHSGSKSGPSRLSSLPSALSNIYRLSSNPCASSPSQAPGSHSLSNERETDSLGGWWIETLTSLVFQDCNGILDSSDNNLLSPESSPFSLSPNKTITDISAPLTKRRRTTTNGYISDPDPVTSIQHHDTIPVDIRNWLTQFQQAAAPLSSQNSLTEKLLCGDTSERFEMNSLHSHCLSDSLSMRTIHSPKIPNEAMTKLHSAECCTDKDSLCSTTHFACCMDGDYTRLSPLVNRSIESTVSNCPRSSSDSSHYLNRINNEHKHLFMDRIMNDSELHDDIPSNQQRHCTTTEITDSCFNKEAPNFSDNSIEQSHHPLLSSMMKLSPEQSYNEITHDVPTDFSNQDWMILKQKHHVGNPEVLSCFSGMPTDLGALIAASASSLRCCTNNSEQQSHTNGQITSSDAPSLAAAASAAATVLGFTKSQLPTKSQRLVSFNDTSHTTECINKDTPLLQTVSLGTPDDTQHTSPTLIIDTVNPLHYAHPQTTSLISLNSTPTILPDYIIPTNHHVNDLTNVNSPQSLETEPTNRVICHTTDCFKSQHLNNLTDIQEKVLPTETACCTTRCVKIDDTITEKSSTRLNCNEHTPYSHMSKLPTHSNSSFQSSSIDATIQTSSFDRSVSSTTSLSSSASSSSSSWGNRFTPSYDTTGPNTSSVILPILPPTIPSSASSSSSSSPETTHSQQFSTLSNIPLNDSLEDGFQGEDGLWYRRPDIDDRCLEDLCNLSELKKRERYCKLFVDYERGVSFPLGEGGRELLRACLNAKGCKGRRLQGASVPMLLKLANDWGLWNIAVRIKVERVTGDLCPKHEAFVRFKAMQSHLRKYLKREQMYTERDGTGQITDIRFEEMKYLTLGKDGREKLRTQLRRLHDRDPYRMDDLLERYGFKYSELRNATVPQLLKMAHICCMWDDVIDACKKQEAKRDSRSSMRKVEKNSTNDCIGNGTPTHDDADIIATPSGTSSETPVHFISTPAPIQSSHCPTYTLEPHHHHHHQIPNKSSSLLDTVQQLSEDQKGPITTTHSFIGKSHPGQNKLAEDDQNILESLMNPQQNRRITSY